MSEITTAAVPDVAPLDPLDGSSRPPVIGKPPKPAWLQIVSALVLPLFFVVMFSFCYISAFHQPSPNNAPIVLVGPSAATAQIQAGIEDQGGSAFNISTTTSLTAALDKVKSREALGAIEIGATVTAHVASANGPSTSSAIEAVAQKIAAQSKTTMTVDNVVSLSVKDPTGTGLFYFLIICTIGGYLTITVLSQVAPRQKIRSRYGILAITAVVVPVIEFGIATIFVGTYGASVGAIFAMLGIGAVYTFTVGAIAILANQLAGQASIFLIMTVAIFINFPSAGGAIPATFLPGFWQSIHSFWFGAAAMEPIRAVIYFGGAGAWPWLSHLAIWLVATLALSAVLGVRKAASKSVAAEQVLGAEPAPNAAPALAHHRHVEA